MGRLGRLGLEPACRYERERPGEMIHIDVKKLGRIATAAPANASAAPAGPRDTAPRSKDANTVRRDSRGWDVVHVAIDDATRLAYVEVLDDEKAITADRLPTPRDRALHAYGVTVEQVMTDNGSPYRSTSTPRLPGLRHPPPANPALPAPDQRQSRTVHPHDARRLGLRATIYRNEHRTHRSP